MLPLGWRFKKKQNKMYNYPFFCMILNRRTSGSITSIFAFSVWF